MKWKIMLMVLVTMMLPAANAAAIWDITVESKTISANATGVPVTMYGSWDLPVAYITVPIVVRSVIGGAFWTGALPYDTGGGCDYHPFQFNVSWNFTPYIPGVCWAALEEFHPGVPVSPCDDQGDTGYDGVSPDHFCINAVGPARCNQAEPSGLGFCTWVFDVNGNVGDFEFDTACFTCSLNEIYIIDNQLPPADHGWETSFNKGIITIQPGPPPYDCNFSGPKTWCAYLSPGGEEPFTILMRDANDNPIQDVTGVFLDFSGCDPAEVIPCGDYPMWPLVYGDPSDANGEINFHINAKGNCADCLLEVNIPFCNPVTVPVRTIDFNGDGVVTFSDWNAGPDECHDFNCNGVGRDGGDMFIFSKHHGSICPGNECDQLITGISTDPVGDYVSGDNIDVHFAVTNNNRSWSCVVTSMELLWSEFGVEQTFYSIAPVHTPGITLGPLDFYEYVVEGWEVPTIAEVGDPISLCLRGVLQTNACAPITAEICWDHDVTCAWEEAECDTTKIFVPVGYSLEYITGAAPDWTVSVVYAAMDTAMAIICKPENSAAGEGASVQFEIRDGANALVSTPIIYFEHDIFPGDCNSDCKVDPLDVQWLVCYVYKSACELNPWKNGNVYCPEGLASVDPIDVAYLVNYVYRQSYAPKDCPGQDN